MNQEWLNRLGIPTMQTQVLTLLVAGQQLQLIAANMQKSIGRIYGMSIDCNTVTPLNAALITSAQAMSMYITFVKGTDNYFGPLRLDNLDFNPVGVPALPAQKYFPVNIPGEIDLDKSFYSNPLLVAAVNIQLNLFYIDKATYALMEKEKIVLRNAQKV
jgi:hypothetical protein